MILFHPLIKYSMFVVNSCESVLFNRGRTIHETKYLEASSYVKWHVPQANPYWRDRHKCKYE